MITDESNKYFATHYVNNQKKKASRGSIFSEYERSNSISEIDILKFIAIKIISGLNPISSMSLFWKEDPKYRNIAVSSVMSRLHYDYINASLHLEEKQNNETSLTYKIELILENIIGNLNNNCKLGPDQTIDESMINFRGRTKFVFYLPMKPTKWGFKVHCLCDSETGYCYDMKFDEGKGKAKINYTYNLVKDFAKPLENSGRHIIMDSIHVILELIFLKNCLEWAFLLRE